ncbi:MAG TPA: ABC transporter substrate-binding protein [Ruminococcaceae bacterium]|nr:ABC transporter substrate-binding protein [Oscillospiraceae bacterium]
MKNLKKLLALTLAVLFVFSLTACVKDSDKTTVSEGKLTMATNATFPPYEYIEGNKVVGIDAEIAALIAKKLDLELEIKDTEFDSIIPGVQKNKYDIGMAGMTVTDERKQQVSFSSSYAKGVQVVIVTEDSKIKTTDDLKGKKIGVQQSTTGDIYASDDFGEDNVTRYGNGNMAVEALKAGKVDCVIIDNEPAKAYVAANKGLKILDTSYAEEEYAICINKNNKDLQKKIDKALKELIDDGSVQKIIDKYISADAE